MTHLHGPILIAPSKSPSKSAPTLTIFYSRSYIKGWLPRQHQSILSVDDKALVNALYPPPGDTHKWSDPLASPEPVELEESEDESEEEEDDSE